MVLDLSLPQSEHKMLPLPLITTRLPVRRLQPAGVQRLRKSIQRSGFLENFPLLVLALDDGTFQLLDGNHRYEAACLEQIASVPCVVKSHLTTQECYTLTFRSNSAAGTVIPSTLVTYAEFIWQRQDEYNQQEIADMLGWGRTQVANYAALQHIGSQAWQWIVTTFEAPVTDEGVEPVTSSVTGVTFTENLLRSILGLSEEQQLELVVALTHPEKEQRISKGKFNELAKAYQARNDMYPFACQHLGDLGEPWTTRLQEEILSGAFDQDWKTHNHPKLHKLITSLRDEWERKHSVHLVQGDFSEEVAKLGEGCIDLILTDPPYNIARENTFELEGRAKISQDFGPWDQYSDQEFLALFTHWAHAWARLLREQGSGYVFTSDRVLSHLRDALEEAGLHVKATIVWHKSNPGTQVVKTNFKSSVEYVLFFTKSEGGHTFNWQGENEMHNYIETAICGGNERVVDSKGETLHPTQKPERLLQHFLEISSNRGDTVFDGFAGVGSVGAVAKRFGRKFIGIEQHPAFFEAMQRRLAE